MNKPLIYLAGPIMGFKACADWRDSATALFDNYGIGVLNPLRHKEQIAVNTSAMPQVTDDIRDKEKIIRRRDKLDVRQSSGVLAYFTGAEKASVGTCIEMGWADAFDKPIIAVIERGVGNPHDHAMLRELSWHVTPDLEYAVQLMASWLLPA